MQFNEICRLCLYTDDNLLPLNDNSQTLLEKIHTISSKVEVVVGDGFPEQVCQECVKLVNLCYNFKLQVEKSDMTLKNYVNSSQGLRSAHDSNDEDGKTFVDWELLCNSTKIEVDDTILETNKNSSSSETLQEVTIKVEHTGSTNTYSTNAQPTITIMSEQNRMLTGNRVEPIDQMINSCKEKNLCQTFNKCGNELENESANQVIKETTVASLKTESKPIPSINIQQPVFSKDPNTLKTSIRISRAIRRRKYRECNVCGKSVQNLKDHIKVHSGDKPHQCTICGHRFIQKGNLQKHLLAHTGERPYICTDCGKTYICISHLNQHRKLHIGTSFICTICQKWFRCRQDLECHEKIHTGEKPYLCQTCGNCFASKGSLTNHSKSVHANDLTHYCSVCNKRFINQSYLKKHFRIHTGEKPYTCDICQNSFSVRSSFVRHLGVHSGEKGFSCFVCSKSFTQQISLKRHIRLHTGEKPFHCTICDENFVLKRDLKKHAERLHREDIQ